MRFALLACVTLSRADTVLRRYVRSVNPQSVTGTVHEPAEVDFSKLDDLNIIQSLKTISFARDINGLSEHERKLSRNCDLLAMLKTGEAGEILRDIVSITFGHIEGDRIPIEALEMMNNLEKVYLSDVKDLPMWIRALEGRVKNLHVDSSSMSLEIFKRLLEMKGVTSLSISGSTIEWHGEEPPRLFKFTTRVSKKITEFRAHFIKFEGFEGGWEWLIREVCRLRNLTTLHMGGKRRMQHVLDTNGLNIAKCWPNMRELWLNNIRSDEKDLNYETFRTITTFKHLKHLSIGGTDILGASPEITDPESLNWDLGNLKETLETLDVSNCNLPGEFLDAVFDCKCLRILDIGENENIGPKFENVSPKWHLFMPQLRMLYVPSTGLTFEGFKTICRSRYLRCLRASFNPALGGDAIPADFSFDPIKYNLDELIMTGIDFSESALEAFRKLKEYGKPRMAVHLSHWHGRSDAFFMNK